MSLAGTWAISCDHCGNFVKLTGSIVFPLKLCPQRSVEDADVAERAQPCLFKSQIDGYLLVAVIERPHANLDGPLLQERCPGAG